MEFFGSSCTWEYPQTYWLCQDRSVVKRLDLQSKDLRIAGSSPTAGGVFFWYGPLANLSLTIASVGSDHHAKKWRSQPVD